MTKFDDIFVPLAFKLIEAAGKLTTFTEPQEDGNYDPKIGGVTPITTVDHLKVKISPPSSSVRKFSERDLLEEGEQLCLIHTQGNAFTAQANWIDKSGKGWQILIDNITWTIEKGMPIYSGEKIAAWKLKIAK